MVLKCTLLIYSHKLQSIHSPRQSDLEKELEIACLLGDTELTDTTLSEIATATDADDTLVKVRQLTQDGWPLSRSIVSANAMAFISFSDELSMANGILVKNTQHVILMSLHKKTLQHFHEAHMGKKPQFV